MQYVVTLDFFDSPIFSSLNRKYPLIEIAIDHGKGKPDAHRGQKEREGLGMRESQRAQQRLAIAPVPLHAHP